RLLGRVNTTGPVEVDQLRTLLTDQRPTGSREAALGVGRDRGRARQAGVRPDRFGDVVEHLFDAVVVDRLDHKVDRLGGDGPQAVPDVADAVDALFKTGGDGVADELADRVEDRLDPVVPDVADRVPDAVPNRRDD